MNFAEKIRQDKPLLKYEKVWLDFYTECYENACPPANFTQLVKDAKFVGWAYNIRWQDYIIHEKNLKEITKKHKPKYLNTINGCMPKIIKYE